MDVKILSGAHQSLKQMGSATYFPPGKSSRSVTLTTHLHLVLR